MNYYFQSRCYTVKSDYYSAIAADCPPVSDGATITCTPDTTHILVSMQDIQSGITTQQNYVPAEIPCPDLTADVVSLGWQVVLVLVIAWGLRVAYSMVTR